MVSKGYGLTVPEIDSSCPTDLQPYADAYILERKQRDTEAWMQWGAYGLSAIGTAIERNLAGKKSRSQYTKHPVMGRFMGSSENTNAESSEECAVYEMKQRINLLRQSGLPEGPD